MRNSILQRAEGQETRGTKGTPARGCTRCGPGPPYRPQPVQASPRLHGSPGITPKHRVGSVPSVRTLSTSKTPSETAAEGNAVGAASIVAPERGDLISAGYETLVTVHGKLFTCAGEEHRKTTRVRPEPEMSEGTESSRPCTTTPLERLATFDRGGRDSTWNSRDDNSWVERRRP